MRGPVGVPFTAFELVLEEMHAQRRAGLRDWQESSVTRGWRENGLPEGKFSDEIGKDFERFSLAHSSWTSLSRRILGRILILLDPSPKSAEAATSTPTLGLWTREVHLSFSAHSESYGGFGLSSKLWNAIKSVFARTPAVLTFCLQSASRTHYRIDYCMEEFSSALSQFTRLRTLRLYSDIYHGPGNEPHEYLFPEECPYLFHVLEQNPHFKCLTTRNFLPCYKLVRRNEEPEHPDPYVMSKLVDDSSPLSGRIYSLAELIRTICNTPTEVTRDGAMGVGNSLQFAAFVYDPTRKQFVIKAAHIWDSGELPNEDIRPPSFKYEKWCSDMECLDICSPYNVFKSLSPFPSLKFLHASVSTSEEDPPRGRRAELRWFLDSLPPTLRVLDIHLFWNASAYTELLPQENLDGLDGMLATIPAIRCPNLKVFGLQVSFGTGLWMPLSRLQSSCEERGVPLVFGEEELEDGDVCKASETDYLLEFDNHI